MVKGLDMFRTWFGRFPEEYVLIGGTAASLVMNEAGADFRQTKDIDIVLIVEALSTEFIAIFWEFVRAGEYEIRQAEVTGKPRLYRFMKPKADDFPYMIELFARAPAGIEIALGSNLTPIPAGELVSSLSAILLNDEYYEFIVANRRIIDGLPVIAEAGLIALKAQAWINLTEANAAGEEVDSRNIRKHLNDIVALVRLLQQDITIGVSSKIKSDLQRLLDANDGESRKRNEVAVAFDRMRSAYNLR